MKFMALRGDARKVLDPKHAEKVEEACEALGVGMVDDLPDDPSGQSIVGCSPVEWGTSFPEDMVERGPCAWCEREIIYRKGIYPASYQKVCVPCIMERGESEAH